MSAPYRMIACLLFASGVVLALFALAFLFNANVGAGLGGGTRTLVIGMLFVVAGFDFGIGYVFLRKSKASGP